MLLALLLSLVAHTTNVPSYVPLKLHELIVCADLCFTGRIVEVGAETIEVKVEALGFGEPGGERVRIQRFRDWPCAQRWAPYEVGQRCIYFLTADASGRHILGAGCEGEAPVLVLDQVRTGAVDAEDAFEGQAIAFRELFAEARRYREHFRLVVGGERWYERWVEPALSEEELESYRNSTRLAGHLVQRTFRDTLDGSYRDPAARSPRAFEPGRLDLGVGLAPGALLAVPDRDADGMADLLVCQGGSLSLLRLGPRRELLSSTRLPSGNGAWASLAPLGSSAEGAFRFVAGDPGFLQENTLPGRLVVFELTRGGELKKVGAIHTGHPKLQGLAGGFGSDVELLGDLDGDGLVELAVSLGDEEAGGQVQLLSLEYGAELHAALGVGFESELDGELRLAAPGDIDGDGVPDLALTSRREPKDWFEGELHVLLLAPDGAVRAHQRNRGESGSATQDAGGLGVFGRSIAAAGDVDRDGVPDLVLEAPNQGLRIALLARDGSVTRTYMLGPELSGLSEFAGVLALHPGSAQSSRLLCSGVGWLEREPGSSRRSGRQYPSIWSFELAGPASPAAGK